MLHNFGWNGDGNLPTGTLLAAGQTLYGVTLGGGVPNHGTVFKVNTDGTGYQILHGFEGGNDGSDPVYGLCLSGATLYGITDGVDTSYLGNNTGTVFRINLDGTGYGVLTNFNGDEGVSLTLYGTNLYGTTSVRGGHKGGAIFKMNLDGTGLTVIRNFSAAEGAPTAVVASGNILYGATAGDGESNNAGTMFKINADGTGYSLLHSLAAPADGISPSSGAILGGGALYGTTHSGGANNAGGGTLFTCDPNSGDYKVVYNIGSNGEGGWASGQLLLCGNTLIATAAGGNFFPSFGSVFMVNIDGSGFTQLATFSYYDGAYPAGGLTLSGTTLYGTTFQGGEVPLGVLFSLSLPPPSLPSVQTPPTTQTAETGSTVNLRAVVSGWPLQTYQWFFNNTNLIFGATNFFLALTNVQISQAGAYSVVVTNPAGAVTSSPALLNVIAPVSRTPVAAITLMGQPNTSLNLQYSDVLFPVANWSSLASVSMTNTSQVFADVSAPLLGPRFYRAWQHGGTGAVPRLDLKLATGVFLTGTVGKTVKLDYINQVGPINAWVNLATVTLTTSPQLYLDFSARHQPARLYRIIPMP